MIGLDENGKTFAGMQVNDMPQRPVLEDIQEHAKLDAMPEAERNALLEKRRKEHYYGAPRFYAGKSLSGNSVVRLRDADGHPRLSMMVTPDGKASIQFLDADGKVERSITANDVASNDKPAPASRRKSEASGH